MTIETYRRMCRDLYIEAAHDRSGRLIGGESFDGIIDDGQPPIATIYCCWYYGRPAFCLVSPLAMPTHRTTKGRYWPRFRFEFDRQTWHDWNAWMASEFASRAGRGNTILVPDLSVEPESTWDRRREVVSHATVAAVLPQRNWRPIREMGYLPLWWVDDDGDLATGQPLKLYNVRFGHSKWAPRMHSVQPADGTESASASAVDD